MRTWTVPEMTDTALSPVAVAEPDVAQRLAADNLIKNYVIMAMGAGLIPSPVVDMLAVTALEVKMITDMAKTYDFPVPHKLVAIKLLVSVAGSVGSVYLATKLNTVVKAAPVVGHALHVGLLSISGGAAVYAVGKIFQAHYESGGSFLSSDNATIRHFFKDKYREGHRVVSDWAGSPLR